MSSARFQKKYCAIVVRVFMRADVYLWICGRVRRRRSGGSGPVSAKKTVFMFSTEIHGQLFPCFFTSLDNPLVPPTQC